MNGFLLAAALLSPAWAGPRRAPEAPQDKPLRAAVYEGRYLEALRLYDTLVAAGEPSGPAAYFAGWTNMRLHRPEAAKPQLEIAAQAGFSPRGWKTADELLSRAEDQLAALPPLVEVKGLDAAALEPHADSRDGLCGAILDALPEFARLGRSIFAGPPPALRVYLFATHEAMDRLALASGDSRGKRRSTGGFGMVRLSAEDLKRPVAEDSVGLALHETVHAWIATYLRERYDRPITVPAYLDEGLASYVPGLWKPARRPRLEAERLARAARWRAKHGDAPPPDFGTLKAFGSFHDASRDGLDYDLAEMLMERLLGPAERGAARIPALLDALARSGGDDEAAWKEVSGKDAAAEYAALTGELWGRAK